MLNENKRVEVPVEGNSIRTKTSVLSRKLNYSADVCLRLSFYFGVDRAIRLIQNLKCPPAYQPVRVNTLKEDPETVLESLKSVTGVDVQSSMFEDVILVDIEGVFDVREKEKAIIAKDKSAEKVLLGANLYRPGVKRIEKSIRKGDKVNVKTQFGDIIALGVANFSSNGGEIPNLAVRVEQSRYKLVNLENLEAFQRGWAFSAPLLSTQALKWFDPIEERILCAYPDYRDLAYVIILSSGKADLTVMVESNTEERMIKQGLRKLKMSEWEDRITWVKRSRHSRMKSHSFDAALISPKPSKIGIRPRISGYLKEDDILRLSREGKSLMRDILPLVKEGGRVLYLLPSLDPAEGEENISYFIQELGMEAYSRERKVGHKGVDYLPYSDRVLRSYPDQDEDEGWFASLLFKS